MGIITRSSRVAPYILPADAGSSEGPRPLPDDILTKIREFRLDKPLNGIIAATPLDPSLASPALVREVSKVWNLIGTSLLEVEWMNLLVASPGGVVDIQKVMLEIQSTHRQDPLDHTNKYVHMFRKLMSVFKKNGIDIRPGDHLLTTVDQYQQLQQRLDDLDLCKCWPAMRETLMENEWFCCCSSVPRIGADAKTIRAYLRSEKGKSLLKHAWYLDLRGLGLLQIPPELGLFSNIEILDLSNNKISSTNGKAFFTSGDLLSRKFAFSNLRELNLSWNPIDLKGVPSLSNFPKLTFLNLSCIPTLTSLKWIDTEKHRTEALTICLTGSPVCDYIGDNALITHPVSLDAESEAVSNKVNASYVNLKTMKKHVARSPLGKLYHAIVFLGVNDEEVMRLFLMLSDEDQWIIQSSIRGLPRFSAVREEEPISIDMNILRRFIKKAIIYKDRMLRGAHPLNSARIDAQHAEFWRRAFERAHDRVEQLSLSGDYCLTCLADALDAVSSNVFNVI